MKLFDYTKNPFKRKSIKFQRLMNYASTQLDAFTVDNVGGIWTARIAATTTALTALDDGMADNETKLAIQKAQVQAKQAWRAELPGKVGRIYNAVAAEFGDPSPEVTECFPHGRTVFNGCPDGELNDHLTQLKDCVATKSPPVAAGIVTLANTLATEWTGFFTGTGTAKQNKKMMEAARKLARAALADELFKNLLTYGLQFPDNEVKFTEFIPAGLLDAPETTAMPGAATLTSGYAGGLAVPLTMQAEGAEEFILARRMVGEVDFTDLATVPADGEGNATYNDTLPGPGRYEYQSRASNSAGEGPVSNVVLVAAD